MPSAFASDSAPYATATRSTAAAPDPAATAVVQGRAEVLLDDGSIVRGKLLPFREDDALVEVATDVDDAEFPPLRFRRTSLRALKLVGWASTPVLEAAARPFRFEFDDGEVLSGRCVGLSSGATGVWLRVLGVDNLRETWFVDGRRCVQALLDEHPLPPPAAPGDRGRPPRPLSLDELRTLIAVTPAGVVDALPLTETLLRAGHIDRPALQRALAALEAPGPHPPLERILVEHGAISEDQLCMARAEWMGAHVIDPGALLPDGAALALLPRALAERAPALPLLLHEDALVVLVDDPLDKTVLDELRFAVQRPVRPVMAMPGTLRPAIRRAYAGAGAGADESDPDARGLADALMAAPEGADDRNTHVVTESDSALVRLINSTIAEAIARRASDIHVETAEFPRHVRIRLRVDGELQPFIELPARLRFAVVARLKIMAELDISEHRRPQDGKIDFARFGGAHVELRVVTVPTSHGLEDVVLRLLSGLRPRALDDIDLSPANLADLRTAAQRPYGLILICGPTGCGKTTTLHSVMRDLNIDARKIWTAEDPIEITQEGLRQVQVNPHIGWTFAAAMRTFLRADPDVIMIGEMRDEETARIAIDASLTGHLVLSTLHTNSAPESIARLLEIGLDPFNFSDSLLAILAQRLVRRLCPHCREPVVPTEAQLDDLARLYLGDGAEAARCTALRRGWQAGQDGPLRLYRRRGCARCDGHGYLGRLAIHELMLADDAIRAHVRQRAAAAVLQQDALAAGMKTLRQDGIDKILAGLTDLPEVIAATQP